MALIMRMKGQNGFSPCRTCNIKGVSISCTYYVPLWRDKIPGASPQQYNASNLPVHSHEEFLEQAHAVEMAPNNSMHEQLAKWYGIKGIPVLSSISLLSFPSSFPFDFIHLIWENLIPNLILFWTGEFKDLDHQDKSYVTAPHIWNMVGITTAACGATIPAVFLSLQLCYVEDSKNQNITNISCSLSNLLSYVWHLRLMRQCWIRLMRVSSHGFRDTNSEYFIPLVLYIILIEMI